MNRLDMIIEIEGDYINSFIYSGLLFLVDTESKVSTYDWIKIQSWVGQEIINRGRSGSTQRKFIIDENRIKSIQISSLQLDRWPTDINIYNNYLYVANEKGVDAYWFDYQAGWINQKDRLSIWRQYAYKVSVNSDYGLCIAAGSNGIIIASTNTKYITGSNILVTYEINAIDCEWVGQNLVSNSFNEIFLLAFPLVNQNIRKNRKEDMLGNPDKRILNAHKEQKVMYVWLGDTKMYSLLSNGQILIEQLKDQSFAIQEYNKPSELGIDISHEVILSARSGQFGSVIEIGDNLYMINEEGIEKLSYLSTNWRVFPRSKKYQNHIHIVEDDCISIRIYEENVLNSRPDKYGTIRKE